MLQAKRKDYITKALVLMNLWAAINGIWAIAEFMIYGTTKPSIEDAVIGIALTASIYFNIKHYFDV